MGSIAVVTGPTGVIGTALVKKLVENNTKVYAVCRPHSHRISTVLKHPLVNIVECNIDNYKYLPEKIKEECYYFYHLAWSGTDNPLNRFDMYLQNENVKYSLDAVRAAKQLGCRVFIGSGSQAEYGNKSGIMKPDTYPDPVSGYGMAKLCSGQMTRYLCNQEGIKHIWPRILSVYGVGDGSQTLISSAIRSMLEGKKFSMTAGDQLWDYLYSEDAADALIALANKGKNGAVYVLGSGRARPLKEYVECIRDIINPQLPIGFGERPYFKDQVMHLEADITAITNDTGWRPRVEFKDGIIDLIHRNKDY